MLTNPEAPYCYRANGMTIASEIALPELRPSGGVADVTIRYGSVPDRMENPRSQGARFQAAPGQYLLHVDEVAGYRVQDGREVTVDPHPGADERDIRVFLLASVMGALVHQRGLLPLHASAVTDGRHGLLFCGKSGAGKSTLAATFFQRGYPFVADDLCAIALDDDGHPIVYPESRRMKLWRDTLEQIPPLSGTATPLRNRLDKHSVAFEEGLLEDPLPVTHLFLLAPTPGPLRITPLTGTEKLSMVRYNTYRAKFLKGFGNQALHFALNNALCQQVQAHRIERPTAGFVANEIADGIEALLER